jgi:hypothetical protein
LTDCSEAIRLEPKNQTAFVNRCAAWNRRGDPERAIKDCSEAININPKFALAYMNRGMPTKLRLILTAR